MKKRRIIIVFVTAVLLVYIPFSPVFTESLHGTQPKSSFPGSDGYTYLWLVRKESFQPFLLFGFWRLGLRGGVNLMFRSQSGDLKAVEIATANIEIDGKAHTLPEIAGTSLQMDSGAFNMYGGVGSIGIIKFDLPDTPDDAVRLHITGTTVNTDNNIAPFDISVTSEIDRDESTILLYQYFLAQLFQT